MQKFCGCLQKHASEKFNFKKKNMKLLTNEQQESYENAKICYSCKKSLKINMRKMKNIKKLEISAIIQIQGLNIVIPKEITMIFHNGSNYGC